MAVTTIIATPVPGGAVQGPSTLVSWTPVDGVIGSITSPESGGSMQLVFSTIGMSTNVSGFGYCTNIAAAIAYTSNGTGSSTGLSFNPFGGGPAFSFNGLNPISSGTITQNVSGSNGQYFDETLIVNPALEPTLSAQWPSGSVLSSFAISQFQFTYTLAHFTLNTVFPAAGDVLGGNSVTITLGDTDGVGANFAGMVALVEFGPGNFASPDSVIDNLTFTITVPASISGEGPVDVTINSVFGANAGVTKVHGYVYGTGPVIPVTSLTPAVGPTIGGS